MYHPTRGGVRGGRDQFTWDEVKVDKHRENYMGHSLMAPVGRWQKGKDLHWYARDKKSDGSNSEAMKEEIRRIKEEEEQAMREALGLAPKRTGKSKGNRLDKHELAELVKRGSTAEDLGAGHAEAAQVQGLGFARGPSGASEEMSLPSSLKTEPVAKKSEPVEKNISAPTASARHGEKELEDESSRKKRKHEERKRDKHDKHERREKRHSRDSDDKRKHRKHKEKKRYDSD